ncbi:MAG: ParB N-terminal domain-containing protein [Ardenticatenaceae bacterium]|nr:ParB N-terminal domain-containing protein [Ardenticatenaceae bacterium]
MAKKRKTTGLSDLLFDDINPYGPMVGEQLAQLAERFPLTAIRPDPEQPRRLLPHDLADAVHAGELEPAAAVREWLQRAADDDNANLVGEVRELRRLASAIAQHGLINPITVRPSDLGDDRYIIVTGERRYWAHILLTLEKRQIHEGEAILPPDQIKAAVVPPGVSIRAHQIVENLMREDINVVEKAHGLWALRREMTGAVEGSKKPRLVPWKQVEEALDMSRQYRLRTVGVLDLSDQAQAVIDRHNLAEATIRPIIEKLKPYPDLQIQALHQLLAWQAAEARGLGAGRRIVPSVRAYVEKLLAARESPTRTRGRAVRGLDFQQFQQKVRGTLRYLRKIDESGRTDFARIVENESGMEIVGELQALRDEIDGMLASLPQDEA